jgi:hypothetical protein
LARGVLYRMGMRFTLVLLGLSFAALSACGLVDGGQACTLELRFGVNVTVKAPDGTPICDAKVTLIDGEYMETVEVFAGQCSYAGAGERAGTYKIEVERAGFQKAVLENVEVTEDECHVNPVSKEITLQEI